MSDEDCVLSIISIFKSSKYSINNTQFSIHNFKKLQFSGRVLPFLFGLLSK